jgi:hypothetical protein
LSSFVSTLSEFSLLEPSMTNPKKFSHKPECGVNIYEDTAKGEASIFAGFGVAAPPALAAPALAVLRTQAEAKSRLEANAQMDAIAAYSCPHGCGVKADVSKDLSGPATWVGQPKLVHHVVHINQVINGVFVNLVNADWQDWVQEAEQDYQVVFQCVSEG